jgi:hypothetical protein
MVTKPETTVSPPLNTLRGSNSRLELYADRLVIKRSGWLNTFFGDEQTIDLADLADVRVFESRFYTRGYLQFIFTDGKTDGLVFAAKEYRAALDMKAAIEDALAKRQLCPDRAGIRVTA